MTFARSRTSWTAAAVAILGVVSGQTGAFAARWEPPFNPQLLPAEPVQDRHKRTLAGLPRIPALNGCEGLVVVPYPHGLRLLAVADGELPGTLRNQPRPTACNGVILVHYPQGFPLLHTADDGWAEVRGLMLHMRELAIQAATQALTIRERAALNVAFRTELHRIAIVATSLTFEGIPLLDGSENVCLEGRLPSRNPTFYLDLPAATPSVLGLSGASFSLTSVTNAAGVLNGIDTAIDTVMQARATLGTAKLALEPPDGGLREVQRVLRRMRELARRARGHGYVSYRERFLLDVFFQAHQARLDNIANSLTFEGIGLLDGSEDVCLQGPPPLGLPIFVDLPDATRTTLLLSGDLTTLTHATSALSQIDSALETVAEYREDLFSARRSLTHGRDRL